MRTRNNPRTVPALAVLFVIPLGVAFGWRVTCAAAEPTVPRNGLLVLYNFDSDEGDVVEDRSGVGQPLNLRIEKPKAVRRSKGSLEVRSETLIRSEGPATRISNSIKRSGAVSIEAWVRPANDRQSGPARIVSLSKSSILRNLTLGQDGKKFDVRLRTTKTSTNGLPSLSSGGSPVASRLTHVVYTRGRSGQAKLYVNGKLLSEQVIEGQFGNWDPSMRLTLSNEISGDRAWLGTYYMVALYGRDLTAKEVLGNYKAGADARTAPKVATDLRALNFETKVAPILANHCLECHDPSTQQGQLDLSRKLQALAGGENGKVIIPGKAADSPLWEAIESDEMPADRPPLSGDEKRIVKKWIEDGAAWSLERIDPAVYAHDGQTGRNFLRRLTVKEYVETVRTAVGVDIEKEARSILPPDLRADGFSNTAYNLNVDLKHVDAYAQLAEIIVERMNVESFARRYSRSKRLTDDNMRALISKMGQWVLRGPLEEHEIVSYRGITTTVASAGGTFEEAVGFALEAMLQSPRFIYRVENQQGDGSRWPVGDYELASRVSYILWGAPPDQELMKAAGDGDLSDPQKLRNHVARMLKDPRAIARSLEFANDWLNLDRLDSLRPNAKMYPNWNPALAADMREETLHFFREVVWNRQRPLTDLLNAQVTYLTPELARHYGLEARGESGIAEYDVSDIPSRGGLLTQGSVLTVGGDEASMVSRGLFVMHDLLRGVVKDPPPCVDTTPTPTKAGLTQRGIAEMRIGNNNCGGCHSKFEPLAFGLEKFDGLGTFHDRDEHGNRLRDDGEILFPGQEKSVRYKSSAALMNLLADGERVQQSLTWRVTQYAVGRPLGAGDVAVVERIHAAAQGAGGTYQSLITAIVMSELVQSIRTEPKP